LQKSIFLYRIVPIINHKSSLKNSGGNPVLRFVRFLDWRKNEITNIEKNIFNYHVDILNEILRITFEIKLPMYDKIENIELMIHIVKIVF